MLGNTATLHHQPTPSADARNRGHDGECVPFDLAISLWIVARSLGCSCDKRLPKACKLAQSISRFGRHDTAMLNQLLTHKAISALKQE